MVVIFFFFCYFGHKNKEKSLDLRIKLFLTKKFSTRSFWLPLQTFNTFSSENFAKFSCEKCQTRTHVLNLIHFQDDIVHFFSKKRWSRAEVFIKPLKNLSIVLTLNYYLNLIFFTPLEYILKQLKNIITKKYNLTLSGRTWLLILFIYLVNNFYIS